jgi:AcrR family transcriptional regulator
MGQKERREREIQQRREQILGAARTLLFEEGFQKASVNKISKKAELSIGSIYFYFKNKEEIFAALEEEGLDILHRMIESETKDLCDGTERLRKGARVYYRFSLTHSEYFDVLNYFLSSPQIFFSDDINQTIDSKAALILRNIADTVEKGSQEGLFDCPQPGSFAVFFWASLHGLIQVRKLRGTIIENRDFESFFQYSVERLIDSIRRK